MSAMLEKAARALCKARAVRSGLANDHADYVAGEKWPEWIGEARAVLLAVREPDLAMRKVSTFSAAEQDWPAMIDAILAGETEK